MHALKLVAGLQIYFKRYPDSILRIKNDIGKILISLSYSEHRGEMEAFVAV